MSAPNGAASGVRAAQFIPRFPRIQAIKQASPSSGRFRKISHAGHGAVVGFADPDAVLFERFHDFAWYGHLKFKESPLGLVVMISWGIAFSEYWLAVPANRWGSSVYSAAELKTIQEVITLVVFAGFSVLYLKIAVGLELRSGLCVRFPWRVFHFPKW